MTLPDCPNCDANQTLSAVRADRHGLRWCECSCCGLTALVNAAGVVVWKAIQPDVRDVNGVVIDGP